MNYIRQATVADVGEILAIYAPYVEKTPYTFETEVPSRNDFRDRINQICLHFPYLVYVEGNEIVGYSYAGKFRERSAYRFMAETSVYVKEGFSGKGIGKALYDRLLILLERLGYLKVYAGVGMPNENSVNFHKTMGFKEAFCQKGAGFKLGEWHDCLYFEKEIVKDYRNCLNPTEPVSIRDISNDEIRSVLML